MSLQNINSSLSWNDKPEPQSTTTSWNVENLIFVLSQKVQGNTTLAIIKCFLSS